MKRTAFIAALTFVITLALIFGIRASTDAVAVILGVILGVVASVPTTVLVMYILTRFRSDHTSSQTTAVPYQPPVIVINGSDRPGAAGAAAPPLLNAPATERKWTVIGDVDTGAYEEVEF